MRNERNFYQFVQLFKIIFNLYVNLFSAASSFVMPTSETIQQVEEFDFAYQIES